MQLPSGHIHVSCRFSVVQSEELDGQLVGMFRLNTVLAPCQKEFLDSGMAKALDHALSVAPRASLVKRLASRAPIRAAGIGSLQSALDWRSAAAARLVFAA